MKLFATTLAAVVVAHGCFADVVRYKAVFDPDLTTFFDRRIDVNNPPITSDPDYYQGFLSLEWSFDWGLEATDPGSSAAYSDMVIKGLGTPQIIPDPLISSFATSMGGAFIDGPASPWFEGDFGTGLVGFAAPATADEVLASGVGIFGTLFGPMSADDGQTDFEVTSSAHWVTTAPVPIPASLPLLIAGLGGLAFVARRQRRATAS